VALKKLQRAAAPAVSSDAADRLADRLADRAYGEEKPEPEQLTRTTISLPQDMLDKLENTAIANKRAKHDHRSVSAIVRAAVEDYFILHK